MTFLSVAGCFLNPVVKNVRITKNVLRPKKKMLDKTKFSIHCLIGTYAHIGSTMYKNELPEPCNCLNCGTAVYGRPDKKFCSDKCRHDYHNLSANAIRSVRRAALRSLDSNYRILDQFVRMGMASVSLESALALGFDPAAHSRSQKGERGHTLYRCYDIEYVMTTSRLLKIKRVNP